MSSRDGEVDSRVPTSDRGLNGSRTGTQRGIWAGIFREDGVEVGRGSGVRIVDIERCQYHLR